jgi:hypothetical protein
MAAVNSRQTMHKEASFVDESADDAFKDNAPKFLNKFISRYFEGQLYYGIIYGFHTSAGHYFTVSFRNGQYPCTLSISQKFNGSFKIRYYMKTATINPSSLARYINPSFLMKTCLPSAQKNAGRF